jgi:hypothetical protein
MRTVISSGWTIIFKVVVPILVTLISLLVLFCLIAFPPDAPSGALIAFLLSFAAALFFIWWGAKLKVVSIDQDTLYVSNLRREIALPFAAIELVYDLQGGCPVIVRLREKSEFGRTIFFMATWQPPLFGKSHPVVKELTKLVNESRA